MQSEAVIEREGPCLFSFNPISFSSGLWSSKAFDTSWIVRCDIYNISFKIKLFKFYFYM